MYELLIAIAAAEGACAAEEASATGSPSSAMSGTCSGMASEPQALMPPCAAFIADNSSESELGQATAACCFRSSHSLRTGTRTLVIEPLLSICS